MKQKTIVKIKQESKEQSKSKMSLKQKVALHALQKQVQVSQLKEYLIMGGFIFGGALLRVPMQYVPSAEPLTFFAILAGWLFGKKKGIMVGAGSLYVSNFLVFGGQGPWTIFQAIGFGAAGYLGGFLRKKSTIIEIIIITIISTLIFEIIMNFSSILIFPYSIFALFLTALPFTLVHLISNTTFCFFLPKAKSIVEKKGGIDEKIMAEETIKKIKSLHNG